MDLRRPIGRAAVVRRRDSLVALDELPPQRVQISVRIGVERTLERVHHEHPAREHEQLRGTRAQQTALELGALVGAQPEDLLEPVAPPGECSEEERRGLGCDEMGRPQEPGQLRPDPEVVDAVAELVEHRVHRVVRRHDVRQDPDVAGAVDVDAERVLVLAVARVQVASLDDPVDLEPDTRHRATRQPDDVLALEERVEIDGPVRRRLLEERIRVVPRAQVSASRSRTSRRVARRARLSSARTART